MNLVYPKDYSSASIQRLLDAADSEVLFLGDPRVNIEPGPRMFDRMAQVMRETGGGWVYADAVGHPRIDYQRGSVRDNFDFGPVVGVSVQAARQSGIDDDLEMGRTIRPAVEDFGKTRHRADSRTVVQRVDD